MEWIQPMEPVLSSEIMSGPEWIHEIKWDGIRGLSYIEDKSLKLYTKHGNERTAFYPELKEITRLVDAKDAVLDGEIIVPDSSGKPSFYSSLVRERVRDAEKIRFYSEKYPALYVLFDILYLNGKSLTLSPLSERKRLLEATVARSSTITLTDAFSSGEDLYALMKEKSWEGIVSKRKDSLYIPGKKHSQWFKTKLSRRMLAVIGGIQWKDNLPNSLLLGIYKEASLIFTGRASLGLTQEHLYLLRDTAQEISRETSPFRKESLPVIRERITWVTPLLTCWVHFMEYTNDGQLRHPKILGFSQAKPEEAVGKEYVE